MEMFRNWLKSMATEDLMSMMVSLSSHISGLRDKPFCTIRQMEDMQNDLGVNRILLQLTFEELHSNSRELSEEDCQKLSELLNQ